MAERDYHPDFEAVFLGNGAGSLRCECSCGRQHFTDYGHGDWEEGEFERLRKLAQEKPKAYVWHEGDDFVSSRVVLGAIYVLGCECDYAERVEWALWNHREQIAEYLTRRTQREVTEAMAKSAKLSGLSDALKGNSDG